MTGKDPGHCAHASINRVMDTWLCNDCGAEFKPVNPEHKTSWKVQDDEP